jgi:transposase
MARERVLARLRPWMAYAGLVRSEHSTGGSQRQGGLTSTGNRRLRRILVKAAWSYRHRPAVKTTVRGRQAGQPARVRDIAWKAQDRLHRKYTRLLARGKPRVPR